MAFSKSRKIKNITEYGWNATEYVGDKGKVWNMQK
jgi:hypothetical protein